MAHTSVTYIFELVEKTVSPWNNASHNLVDLVHRLSFSLFYSCLVSTNHFNFKRRRFDLILHFRDPSWVVKKTQIITTRYFALVNRGTKCPICSHLTFIFNEAVNCLDYEGTMNIPMCLARGKPMNHWSLNQENIGNFVRKKGM